MCVQPQFRGCTSGGVYVPCIYMHARCVTVVDSGLCCCTCVVYFERQLTPLCVEHHFLKPLGIQGTDQPTVDDQVQSE